MAEAWDFQANDLSESDGTGVARDTSWSCTWQSAPGAVGDGVDPQQEYDDIRPDGNGTIPLWRRCENTDTGNVVEEVVDWSPSTPEPEVVAPEVLAEQARSAFTLPVPQATTTPPIDPGSYAQLETFLGVTNSTGDLTATATAGSTTVTVTASPDEQHWSIHDDLRGETYSDSCDAASANSCSWTPAHSSEGQPATPWTGEEDCFGGVVSVRWEMEWTSNTGASGALDPGWVSGSICLPVAEVQAVVNHG